MDNKKLLEAYKFTKENRRRFGGSWAGFRNAVYAKEVLGLSLEEYSAMSYWKVEKAPLSWTLPPEYMVAFLRNVRDMPKAKAIVEVERTYIPAAEKWKRETYPQATGKAPARRIVVSKTGFADKRQVRMSRKHHRGWKRVKL